MHIDTSTHEHGSSAKVYTYDGDYEIDDGAIRWTATISRDQEAPHQIDGSIPLSSPDLATLAEQAVRDAIVQWFDRFDDRQTAGYEGSGTAG